MKIMKLELRWFPGGERGSYLACQNLDEAKQAIIKQVVKDGEAPPEDLSFEESSIDTILRVVRAYEKEKRDSVDELFFGGPGEKVDLAKVYKRLYEAELAIKAGVNCYHLFDYIIPSEEIYKAMGSVREFYKKRGLLKQGQ